MERSANTPFAGRKLGQYVLVKEIGRGGMGLVYEATDTALERTVALKVLLVSPLDDPKQAERFMREARSLARLNHPNLLHIYNVGSEPDCSYFAMELLEGASLADVLSQRRRLPPEELISYAGQILSALHYVHGHGITHRDVKSGNIMLCGRRAVLMDFGLAKDAQYSGLTSMGVVLGTPEYMAPESAEGISVGPPTDIYGLGVVMYEALSGQLPFTGRSAMSIMRQQIDKAPPPLRGLAPEIDPALAAIVHKCLAKKPEERYADCPALARALAGIQATPEVDALVDAGGGTVLSAPAPKVPAGWLTADTAPSASRRLSKQLSADATALEATVVLKAPVIELSDSSRFTAANTVVHPVELRSRSAWLWVFAGFFGVIFMALIFWRIKQPREPASAVWQGQTVVPHKPGAAESPEIRWVEFNANDPDPEKWYHVVDRRQSDGSWMREKVSHREFVAGPGEMLDFKGSGTSK